MSAKLECSPGCVWYAGRETKHHKDCPIYPESLTKRYDDEITKLRKTVKIYEAWNCNHQLKMEIKQNEELQNQITTLKKEIKALKDNIALEEQAINIAYQKGFSDGKNKNI